MRVLVVEDDEMIAEGLRFSLMSEDYEVLSAGTVQEAEKIWRSGMRPDFCLLDVMLPDGRWLFASAGDPAVKQSAGAFSYRL